MKHIRKGEEPRSFGRWKASESENWQPTWDALQHPENGDVRKALLEEQGYLCCYCNQGLPNDSRPNDSLECHIEHVVPGRKPEDPLALVYSNFAMSCSASDHCGNKKGDWYQPDLWVSPYEPSCERRFLYLDDGNVVALSAEDRPAVTTLAKLGLDERRLVAAREAAIQGLIMDSSEVLSGEDLQKLRDGLQKPDRDGRLESFVVALTHALDRLLPPEPEIPTAF